MKRLSSSSSREGEIARLTQADDLQIRADEGHGAASEDVDGAWSGPARPSGSDPTAGGIDGEQGTSSNAPAQPGLNAPLQGSRHAVQQQQMHGGGPDAAAGGAPVTSPLHDRKAHSSDAFAVTAAMNAAQAVPRSNAAQAVLRSTAAEADQGGGSNASADERAQQMQAQKLRATEQRMMTPPLPPRRSSSSRARRRSEGDGAGAAAARRSVSSPDGAIAPADSVGTPGSDTGVIVSPSAAALPPRPTGSHRGMVVSGRGSAPRPPPKSSRRSFDRYEVQVNQPRWQQWQGNNSFFCGGRVMVGVHHRQLGVTVALLLLTWALFYVFIYPDWGGAGYAAAAAGLFLATAVSLGYASLLDPGIIPRRPPNQVVENMPPSVKDRMNYCATCHVLRPPRAKHCRHCNNCVSAFDHHCPWTGNCVGRRNYRSFFAFILFVSVSAAYIFSLSIVSIITLLGNTGPVGVTDAHGVPYARYFVPLLAMWSIIILVLVGGLLLFHTFLLMRGQTTNEYLRGEKRRGGVPHKSFLPNCADLWCIRTPPSLLPDMRQFPSEEDHRKDGDFTLAAVAELQNSMRDPPFGGDAV